MNDTFQNWDSEGDAGVFDAVLPTEFSMLLKT